MNGYSTLLEPGGWVSNALQEIVIATTWCSTDETHPSVSVLETLHVVGHGRDMLGRGVGHGLESG